MNNVLRTKNSSISDLFELQSITNGINDLKKQIEIISKDLEIDHFERKIKIRELNEEVIMLKNRLLKGISIDCNELKNEITNNIVSFLEPFGFEKNNILERLETIEFYITNERVSSGGLLASYSNKIAIDYTFCDFDEQGNFLKFKEDKKEFIKYTLTHEILHICSIRSNKSFRDDPLSEGYTDLFAQIISKNKKDKSARYDFFVRLCLLFTNLVGIKNTLDDYFNNLDTLPNLTSLFEDCGIDDLTFLEFKTNLNNIMNKEIDNKNPNELFSLKQELLQYVKNYILIPFLKKNDANKESFVNLFNNLFETFNVTAMLDEFSFNIK